MSKPTSDEAIDATIAAIESEIDSLRRTRETLLRLRNKPVGDATIAGPGTSTPPTSPTTVIDDAMTAVREQEFSGMAATQAARVFLQRIGRNEKTPVILAAIQKGGVQVGGLNKVGRLYTALTRHSAFVALGKNYWDLAERRPDLAQEKKQQRLAGSKRKKKKPGPKPGSKRVVRLAPEAATA
jgi:hypothetical protein